MTALTISPAALALVLMTVSLAGLNHAGKRHALALARTNAAACAGPMYGASAM
jgi:hypothetical protein